MRILVITVTRNRKGQALRTERALEGETIRLGRGTQCEIHLADPRVSLYHATIYRQGDSSFIQAQKAKLSVDGKLEREARLVPGVLVALGPYDLTVEPSPEGYELALAIELARPLPDDLAEVKAKSPTTLEESGLSRRTLSWMLGLLIAVLFLAVPVINALLPQLRSLTADLPVTPDQSWNPGVLFAAHQQFGRNCGKCHEKPFVHVRDQACLDCHRDTPGHIAAAAVQQRLFDGTRCAKCHADHKGALSLVRRDSALCVSCHGDLRRRESDTTLADATDFAANHPAFKLTIWQGPGARDAIRVPQTDKGRLIERPHLKFPHDVHLKTSLRGPKGRKVLECASCHVYDASGRTFAPINMKQACLECHTLAFEPAVTTREVPHGSVDDAMLTMQEFYASVALNLIPVDVVNLGDIRRGLPRLIGDAISDAQRQQARAWAKAKAAQVSEDLFEKRVCIVCHEVVRTVKARTTGTEPRWAITPVHLTNSWFPKARFDHASHRTGNFKCADCHDVAKSHSSSDISIPDIAKCRKCHAGNAPAGNKVVSTCVSCHGFHLPGHPPFGTPAPEMAPMARKPQ